MTTLRTRLQNGVLVPTALLAALFCPLQTDAITLDWNNVNYTAGSLSQSFDIDASNAGSDITITVTGNTGDFNTNYPDDTTNLTGGHAATEESLQFYMNTFVNDTHSVKITITFNYAAGVDFADFTIFDIDTGTGWKDQIRNIRGINSLTGTTNGANITAAKSSPQSSMSTATPPAPPSVPFNGTACTTFITGPKFLK